MHDDIAALARPAEPDLADLAHRRLAELVDDEPPTTLDAVMRSLFNRDHRELLTYSAFGSAL